MEPRSGFFSPRLLAAIVAIAGAYWIAGRLALHWAIPPGVATPIWPASGIALAAILVVGVRAWPGVWLGEVLGDDA